MLPMTTHNLPGKVDLDDYADVDAQKRTLARLFPEWSIIRTRDTGRWWATRGPLTREYLDRTADVSADTAGELYDKLQQIVYPPLP